MYEHEIVILLVLHLSPPQESHDTFSHIESMDHR